MKPKILLIGKNGQIGAGLSTLLPSLGEVVALGRQELDLLKPEEIRQTIRDVRPNILINAAAYTAVDRAEKEEPLARAINADAPGLMAEEALKIGAALIHYSTDYIFDGSKNSPYLEDDRPNPINVYGASKLAGEQAIRSAGVPHLILRTSWVYATRGRNFLLTILRLAAEREELRIVRDQVGAPTSSRDIAMATFEILKDRLAQAGSAASLSIVSGSYHMTAAGETNWYQFAVAILEEASRVPPNTPWFTTVTGGRPILARRVVPILSSEYPTPARRPAYSVLSNSRLINTFGFELPDWRSQLRSVFTNATSNVSS